MSRRLRSEGKQRLVSILRKTIGIAIIIIMRNTIKHNNNNGSIQYNIKECSYDYHYCLSFKGHQMQDGESAVPNKSTPPGRDNLVRDKF